METDQGQVDNTPEIKCPFRVIDDGHSFKCEVVTRIVKDDVVTFYMTSRIYGWELVVGVGPITEPRPYQYDRFDDQLTELTYQGASCEYIRADPEQVGRAWLRYRQQRRRHWLLRLFHYLSAKPTHSPKMETKEQKPLTYLGDVFQSKIYNVVMGVLFLIMLYAGSLKLFADWSDYGYPNEAAAYANWGFYVPFAILLISFLVPALSKERRAARAATRK